MSASLLVSRFLDLTDARRDALAVIDDVESVSFAELGRRALCVAGELQRRGLGGARIALLVTQGSRWLEAFYGVVLAGGVAVPLSPLHPETEQAWFVDTSGARAILVSEEHAAEVAAYAGGRPVLLVEELRAGESPASQPTRDEDTALILYTSGTTGKPKGALITHANLAELARLVGEAWSWSRDDVLLYCLPLHHLHGLGIALFVSLLAGGTTRMLARFDAVQLWEEMSTATVLMGVPTMHKKLLDALDSAEAEVAARWRKHARGLRLVTSGSAALPVTVGERFRELQGEYPLERFGMTEIGVGTSNPLRGSRVPGSCGRTLPGMEIRIVGEDGKDVQAGEAGEIWIRGPSVFAGYDQNEAATREAFVEGWFRSGDTATWLDEGYVKILGRTSVDILKSGGYKLSALEIEEVLRQHPAVADCAVVGLPDETWGEIAVAALIPREGRAAELSEDAVRQFAKQHIAAYKVPKRVVVLADFPRNPVGKVVKPELTRLLRTVASE